MGLKDKYWWWRCVNFVTSFFLALQGSTAGSVGLKTFLSLLVSSINVIGIGFLRPLKSPRQNLVRLVPLCSL